MKIRRSNKLRPINVIFQYRSLFIVVIFAIVISAQSPDRKWRLGASGEIKLRENCDFVGGNYDARLRVASLASCEDICLVDQRCSHFTYNFYGTCFLKTLPPGKLENSLENGFFNPTCGYVINRVKPPNKDQISRYREWHQGEHGWFKYRYECSYPGREFEIMSMENEESTTCGEICFGHKRCSHFTQYGGKCHMKTISNTEISLKPVFDNPNGKCGFITERKLTSHWMTSNDGLINWSTDCDFLGHDLDNVVVSDKLKCGHRCLANERCTHFTWVPGRLLSYCYLKDIRTGGAVEVLNENVPVCGFIAARTRETSSTTERTTSASELYTTNNAWVPKENIKTAVLPISNERFPSNGDQVLVWNDEFSSDSIYRKNWKHLTGASKSGFQFYTNHPENSFIRNGVLNIKPTLTSDRFGDDILEKGYLDLIDEGCNPKGRKQCVISATASGDIIQPIASAKLTTEESFNFTFGTVEIRAKMPKGDWISSGISLLPAKSSSSDDPPGEIELFRVNSNRHMSCSNKLSNKNVATSTVYAGSRSTSSPSSSLSVRKFNSSIDFSSDFHVFRMDWTTEGFKFYVDGELIGNLGVSIPKGDPFKLSSITETQNDNPWNSPESQISPFDKPFYFSVGVTVGGNIFPDSCSYLPTRKSWSSKSTAPKRQFWNDIEHWLPTWNSLKGENVFQIDYIRVYNQLK